MEIENLLKILYLGIALISTIAGTILILTDFFTSGILSYILSTLTLILIEIRKINFHNENKNGN